jgi:hypothetical protein
MFQNAPSAAQSDMRSNMLQNMMQQGQARYKAASSKSSMVQKRMMSKAAAQGYYANKF